jgi:hypothetical protein
MMVVAVVVVVVVVMVRIAMMLTCVGNQEPVEIQKIKRSSLSNRS